MLALAMCGRAPLKLGTVMWEEHPTLRALITMVAAGRYRFPTIDCDEDARVQMKRSEQAARDSVCCEKVLRIFSICCFLFSPSASTFETVRKQALLSISFCRANKRTRRKNTRALERLVVYSSNNKRRKLLVNMQVCCCELDALSCVALSCFRNSHCRAV